MKPSGEKIVIPTQFLNEPSLFRLPLCHCLEICALSQTFSDQTGVLGNEMSKQAGVRSVAIKKVHAVTYFLSPF